MDHRTLSEEFAAADRGARRIRRTNAAAVPATAQQRTERWVRELEATRTRRARRRDARRAVGAAFATLGAIALALLAASLLPLTWYQGSLIYWATGARDGALPEGFELRRYPSGDAGTDYAAYVHHGVRGRPVVVYLHGRGEDMGVIVGATRSYVDEGWTVIAPEYPGFAGLAGSPHEKDIGHLVDLVYADLVRNGVDPRRVLVHGNSLGAGPALQLAQHPHGFLLLTAPVGSLAQVVRSYVPFAPPFLLRDRWDNLARAATRYPVPALVVQAADDQVVPVEQGRLLAAAAHAPFHQYPDGGHMIVARPQAAWRDTRFVVTP